MNNTLEINKQTPTNTIPLQSTWKVKPEELCLVGTVALSTLSLMPPYRLASSIALRTVAFLTTSLSCLNRGSDKNPANRILPFAKMAVIGLAIAGVAAASPLAILASMIGDIGYNALEAGKTLYNKDVYNGLTYAAVMVIDSLALTGIALGSWPFMTAAAAISAATMGVFAMASLDKGDKLKAVCYAALMALGLTTAWKISEWSIPARVQFDVSNRTDGPLSFYNKRGELIATLQPGEKRTLDVPTLDAKRDIMGDRYILRLKGDQPFIEGTQGTVWFGRSLGGRWIEHDRDNWKAGKIITQEALAPHLFPTVPVGGTAIAAKEKCD